MVNFGPPETVPAKFRGRRFYQHNPQVTLMRTTSEENCELGRILAEKLNLSTGAVTVLLPLRGNSLISAPGGPFHDPEADQALFTSLRTHLRKGIPIIELDCAINDPPFAEACARELLGSLRTSTISKGPIGIFSTRASGIMSGVSVTGTATPGKPAGFSFNLNRAANVGITYQKAGVTATGSVEPVPLPSGDQTLPWDPIAAGLPPGTYDAALVADDGVSRVVSPSFQVTVATTPPPPTPTPSRAAAPGGRGVKTKVPPWLPVGVGAVLLVVLLLALALSS